LAWTVATVLSDAVARWWTLFAREGLGSSFSWRVEEPGSSFTIYDRMIRMQRSAGVPRLVGTLGYRGGRIVGFTRETIWALSDRGVIEPVVDYKVNSREGRDAIRLVAEQLGLRERLPITPKSPHSVCLPRPRPPPCGAWSPWCSYSWAPIDHGTGDSATSRRPARKPGSPLRNWCDQGWFAAYILKECVFPRAFPRRPRHSLFSPCRRGSGGEDSDRA